MSLSVTLIGNCATAQGNWLMRIIKTRIVPLTVISTPDHWHFPISLAAARSGKDVCCEKPTLTINVGKVLCTTIRRYGRAGDSADYPGHDGEQKCYTGAGTGDFC